MTEKTNQAQSMSTDKHSLKTRYLYKLTTNIMGFGISLVSAAIVPRSLGPKIYGDYNFLTNFFLAIKGFLDGGVSIGFYNKLSQRQKEPGLISFYFIFLLFASAIILGFTILNHFTGAYTRFWPTQNLSYIYMAAVAVILTWFSQGFDQIVDALGLTVFSEYARIAQKVIGISLLILLFVLQILNLQNYFLFQYFNYLLLIGLFFWIIKAKGHFLLWVWKLSIVEIKKYFHEFYHYSFPLFILSIVGLIAGILDRWLLQIYGGSIQQGFYGLSYNIGVLCFLFTGAMTPLIIREYSIAYAERNIQHIAVLFRRYVPMLYAVAAYFACFIAVNSNKVVFIMGGSEYKSADLAVKIMAFYPVHQTYGQLSSSLPLAIGQTKLYRNIGMLFLVIGLVVAFFLLAPHSLMGLNLGSTGLALKMVIINIVSVNCFLYFNCKFLSIPFWKYICYQGLPIVCFIPLAIFSSFICDNIFQLRGHIIVSLLLSGCLYTFIIIVITYFFPIIFGLESKHIDTVLDYIKRCFNINSNKSLNI